MVYALAVLALLPSAALANVFLTSPVASTTFNGGQQATISWQDDGKAPSLADFGNAKVSIYAGNSQQQTSLQTISESVNVATTSSIQFTPDPQIGPNANEYFVRIESLALKDAASPQFPALAFSAKFTMASMTGQFSDAVKAQIAGQATAPIGGTAAAASSSAPAGAASSAPAASKTTSSASKAASSSSTAKATGAASSGNAAVGQTLSSNWVTVVFAAVSGFLFL